VRVTAAFEPTAVVVAVKVAVVAFATTVTLAGTVTAALPLESATTAPPGGALPVSVTVPVEDVPPVTLVGLTPRDEFAAGVTVNVVVLGTVRYVAVSVTGVEEATPSVEAVNVAVEAPAATVTFAGTVAATVLPLESVTTAPPVGALPVRVTVPVEDVPETTLVGLTETAEIAEGLTVRVAVFGTVK
jgi:hypothetical protein